MALLFAPQSGKETREYLGQQRHAAFETGQASTLRALFQLVGARPGTEVLVDGKRVPYATELWLPLFWLFVGEGD